MNLAAIDPGITGAIAFVNQDFEQPSVHDMPIEELHGKNVPDPYKLTDLLWDHQPTTVVIERVVAMGAKGGQKRGIASTGQLMYGAGIVYAAARAIGSRVVWAWPPTWKRDLDLLGKNKDASRVLALERFPELASYLKRKKDGGRADALMILDWYRRFGSKPVLRKASSRRRGQASSEALRLESMTFLAS